MDDHNAVRMGLKMMIEELFLESKVQEAESFPQAMDYLQNENYDLLILDIGIPGGSNTLMIDIIRHIRSTIPILIYTAAEEAKLALRYLKAGATGFLSKNASKEEHKKALLHVIDNKKYISSTISEFILESISAGSPINKIPEKFTLTARENEVSDLLMQGKWTNEISYILGLKPSTVSTFKNRIFNKVGVTNSIDLFKKLNNPETSV